MYLLIEFVNLGVCESNTNTTKSTVNVYFPEKFYKVHPARITMLLMKSSPKITLPFRVLLTSKKYLHFPIYFAL